MAGAAPLTTALALASCLLLCGAASAWTVGSFRRSLIEEGGAGGGEGEEGAQQREVRDARMLTPFRGAGPYDISREYTEWDFEGERSRGYVYAPEARSDKGVVTGVDGGRFPAVVFGHGLCAEPDFYEHMMSILSSWGYVVLATEEHSECDYGTFTGGNPLNTTEYAEELRRNALWLASGARADVNVSALALAGHSMGGGGSVVAAAALAGTHPGLVKAVIAVAPWNGVQPNPSARIPALGSTPVLLICSAKDSLVPCSGPVTTQLSIGIPFASVIPQMHGAHHGVDWNGGVLAIYENVSETTPAILAVVKEANHLNIVDSDGEAGGTKAAQDYFSTFLEFEETSLEPGEVLPTIEYSVAFLEWAIRSDPRAFSLLWGEGGITEDARFVQPVSRSWTDS